MSDLQGQVGELTFTVEVKRAATGLTETHELKGFVNEEQARALGLIPTQKEPSNGSDS